MISKKRAFNSAFFFALMALKNLQVEYICVEFITNK